MYFYGVLKGPHVGNIQRCQGYVGNMWEISPKMESDGKAHIEYELDPKTLKSPVYRNHILWGRHASNHYLGDNCILGIVKVGVQVLGNGTGRPKLFR